ncbi:hypothetical protein AN958_08851 [Leucoagaricus sp. SymC.cos]|nr:hypothetical protein AN958_08851 [Leucoagaricus sp. SymC.cos]
MVIVHALVVLAFCLGLPSVLATSRVSTRALNAAPDNTVVVNNAESYCMIMPRTAHTNIGDSEHPGGMQSFCSAPAHTNDSQGILPGNFWRNVEFKTGNGKNDGKWVQLTGCIRPETVDRLNPDDSGGQYDSSGGDGGKGNPERSACTGPRYNHYVELVEPSGPRACIRCCNDPADCPVNEDIKGCPNVIPGNYFDCDQ